jgi:hypothetical protein
MRNDREEEFFKNLRPEKDNLALNGVKKIKGNLLLIESEKDQIIPGYIIGYFKSAADTKTAITHELMKGAVLWKRIFTVHSRHGSQFTVDMRSRIGVRDDNKACRGCKLPRNDNIRDSSRCSE